MVMKETVAMAVMVEVVGIHRVQVEVTAQTVQMEILAVMAVKVKSIFMIGIVI
jgi:hypothetical protein